MLEQFGRLGRPTLHMLANHDLYNFSRPELNERLGGWVGSLVYGWVRWWVGGWVGVLVHANAARRACLGTMPGTSTCAAAQHQYTPSSHTSSEKAAPCHLMPPSCSTLWATPPLLVGINGFKPDPAAHHSYYAFQPHPRWRLLVLDGYDVSLLGWPPGHSRHEEAARILDLRNPNQVPCRPRQVTKGAGSRMYGWCGASKVYGCRGAGREEAAAHGRLPPPCVPQPATGWPGCKGLPPASRKEEKRVIEKNRLTAAASFLRRCPATGAGEE